MERAAVAAHIFAVQRAGAVDEEEEEKLEFSRDCA